MEIKEFIYRAIKGGWDKSRAEVVNLNMRDGYEGMQTSMQSTDRMFLDPLAWRAIGKVERWGKYEVYVKMHGMIDALIEGQSLEDYIKTL